MAEKLNSRLHCLNLLRDPDFYADPISLVQEHQGDDTVLSSAGLELGRGAVYLGIHLDSLSKPDSEILPNIKSSLQTIADTMHQESDLNTLPELIVGVTYWRLAQAAALWGFTRFNRVDEDVFYKSRNEARGWDEYAISSRTCYERDTQPGQKNRPMKGYGVVAMPTIDFIERWRTRENALATNA